ncbi:MAG: dihydrofolate reductase [Gammaproteobacteria bacterium]|jgi:dihydrofolate reductase
MTDGHVFMATSLDGFVARRDHSLDWLMKYDTPGEDHGSDAFISRIDGLVMGRGSFQNVLSFSRWPYDKPVMVMSKSLTVDDVPEDLRDKVRITKLEPKALMDSLACEGWKHAYVDGGQVVQSCIKAGLIEHITITIIPILLGDGIHLFDEVDADIDLELLESTLFPSGFVQNQYLIKS